MKVAMNDGAINRDTFSVLNKWKSAFELLLNSEDSSEINQVYIHMTESNWLSL